MCIRDSVFFVVVIGLRHRHGIVCQEGSGARRAQLERLRVEGRENGPDWLRATVQKLSWQDVRALAQAAGLPVRKDGTRAWLPVGELRTALLEHLATPDHAAPEEVAAFALFSVSCFVLKFGNSMAILKGF